ncbi:YceI family protein [Actinocrispum sp. NPDC049592]|uniref:YceI family protein n=1 Tax=Actinocrispum sp. NPDC049592 TaxID=3154835 RepID=UPI003428DF55
MTTQLAPGRWLVTAGQNATFTARQFGRDVPGTIPILSGTIEVAENGQPTAIHGELDIGAIDTGIAKRDQDLRKPRLLDLDAHPKMTFRTGTVAVGDDGWRVTGYLTARGETAPIVGTVRIDGPGQHTATLTATTRVDRRDLRLRAPWFLIGRFIEVTVTARISNTVRETSPAVLAER